MGNFGVFSCPACPPGRWAALHCGGSTPKGLPSRPQIEKGGDFISPCSFSSQLSSPLYDLDSVVLFLSSMSVGHFIFSLRLSTLLPLPVNGHFLCPSSWCCGCWLEACWLSPGQHFPNLLLGIFHACPALSCSSLAAGSIKQAPPSSHLLAAAEATSSATAALFPELGSALACCVRLSAGHLPHLPDTAIA